MVAEQGGVHVLIAAGRRGDANSGMGPQAARRFNILRQWEGVVTSVSNENITATLEDLTDDEAAPETVSLPLAEIPPSDRELLQPGCVFYWHIGYDTSEGGQLRRVSEIRVSRTPEWSSHQLARVQSRASEQFDVWMRDARGSTQ